MANNDVNDVITSLGKLAEPATVLIEKVSEAIGGVFHPMQIRRIAKAEADAFCTKAKGQIEAFELMERSINRLVKQENIRQINLQSILKKTIPYVKDNSKPQEIEEDWIRYWFEQCKDISNAEVQEIWARILASESNHPKSFSRKTLSTLNTMDKEDAISFTNLVSFSIVYRDKKYPIILNLDSFFEEFEKLSYNVLVSLESCGLIKYDTYSYFPANGPNDSIFHATYFDKTITFKGSKLEPGPLPVGQLILTKSGQELSNICELKEIHGHLEHLKKYYLEYYFEELIIAP